MKLLLIYNNPNEYNINFLNELSLKFDITVLFEHDISSVKDNFHFDYKFKTIFASGLKFGKNSIGNCISNHLRLYKYDLVIFTSYITDSEKNGINYAIWRRIPYIFLIHGRTTESNSIFYSKKLNKRYLINSEGFLSPNKTVSANLLNNGVDVSKIFEYQYSSVSKKDIFKTKDKQLLRAKLNIPDKYILLLTEYCLTKQYLLGFLSLLKSLDNFHLLFVAKHTNSKLTSVIKKQKISNYTIVQYTNRSEVLEYFRASDAFVFLNESDYSNELTIQAMSAGLPVIDFIPRPESIVVDSLNGFTCSINNSLEINTKINGLMSRHSFLSDNAIETAKNITSDEMVNDLQEKITKICKEPKIIYLTSSMKENDFDHLLRFEETPLNAKRQNLHQSIINSLSNSKNVTVISSRPLHNKPFDQKIVLKGETKLDGKVTYEYVKTESSLFYKTTALNSNLYRVLDYHYRDSRTIILCETTNLNLINVALKLKNKFRATVIGIAYENLNFSSPEEKRKAKLIQMKIKKFDGFITSTEDLAKLYSKKDKPYLILEGIARNYEPLERKQERPYFFYCGYLIERNGVIDLIEAFDELNNKDIDLLIAGYGPLTNKVIEMSKVRRNVKFLGELSRNDIYAYEQHAIACVNPAKVNIIKNKYVIPQKIFEYASNHSLIISTNHKILREIFKENIIWNDTNRLVNSLDLALLITKRKEQYNLINKEIDILNENYIEDIANKKMIEFFDTFIDKKRTKQ